MLRTVGKSFRRRCSVSTAAPGSRCRLATAVQLPAEADVVIIGGGSIGSSTLYHLAKQGVKATLIEGNQLTSGTTWHSAGLLWQLVGLLGQADTDLEMVQYTKGLVTDVLPHETGEWAGWTQQGALFACSSRDRLISHNRMRLLGSALFGIEAYDLSPAEAKKVHPMMNVDDLYGAVHIPGDGTIDPSAIVRAYTKAAKQMGATVCENTRVTGIQQQDGRITGVSTTAGDIRTTAVVNCAGAWSRKIAHMVGLDLPLVAYQHAYVITEPVPGLQGLPSIRDYNQAVYMKVAGDSFHIGGYEHNPVRIQSRGGFDMEDDFAFGLYDLDYDIFGCNLEAHINRVPVLAEVGIQSTVCGPESFTPDHRPLLGEVTELRGFFLGCGLNSAGILYSGGIGRELASWVAAGRPKADVFGMDIRRFHPECVRHASWTVEKSHETYANQSAIPWPHDQPLAGRNVRCSPFHDELVNAGCAMVESHGFERPGFFIPQLGSALGLKPYDFVGAYGHQPHTEYEYREAVESISSYKVHRQWAAEHLACRQNVAVFDTSAFGKLLVTGPDASAAVEWLCTNTVARPPGATTYTLLCNAEGTVEADLTVSALEDGSFYICTGSATATRDKAWIEQVLQDAGYDASVTDISSEIGILSIQGPKSRPLLQELSGADLSNEAFPFSTHQMVGVAGHSGIRAVRVTFVGELGWELHVPRAACADVYKAVMSAGAKHGVSDAGYLATGSLSLEKGYRHWGADLRCTDTPMAAGLAFACKLRDGSPFLGRAALEAAKLSKNRGLHGRVICLTAGHGGEGEQQVPLFGHEPVYRDGRSVGFLRSAGFGFSLDASIGYAWVTREDGDPATLEYLKHGSYEIETYEHGRVPARFNAKAPFDPKGLRVQGHYD